MSRAALPLGLLLATSALADGARLRLEVGKPVERPTKGGEAELLEFVLPEGGFARLQVDQRNAGIRIAVQAPDGRELDWSDETGSYGSEFIALLGVPAGVYALEIRNLGPPDYQG